MRFGANGHNSWSRIGDATRIKLFTADTVDDMPFRQLDIGFRHGANNVDLVIFPRKIVLVDVNHVISIIKSEHWVGFVPMDVVDLFSGLCDV